MVDRFQEEMDLEESQCHGCKHWTGELKCKAFPEGIPIGVLANELSHEEPLPGDNGIVFEPK